MTFWNFVKRAPWTSAIVGVGFLLALVGVIYAIIVRPGDLSFMERDGYQLKWDRGDLPVSCIHLEEVPEDYLRAYNSARTELREKLGSEIVAPCVLWRLQEPPKRAPDGSILLHLRDGEGDAHGAATRHRYDKRDGRILSADVAVDRGFSGEVLRKVVLHELGHVLGLEHDRERSSIMYPTGIDRPNKLSSRDVKSLKAAYFE